MFLQLFAEYAYAFVFLGMLIGGEVALIPAVYFASLGPLNIYILAVLAILAGGFSDSVWYVLGRHFPTEKLFLLPLLRRQEKTINRFSRYFDARSLWILFFSKFVYGTRLATQILCGMRNVHYGKFLLVSALGTLAWTLFLFAVVSAIGVTLPGFEETAFGLQVGFGVFMFVLLVLHVLFKRVSKRWF